jgi:4-amino-4-deoxy-L-arabinose transferase-like glycosyltransferase
MPPGLFLGFTLDITLAGTRPSTSSSPEPTRSRWRFWQSPSGQPSWSRPALLAVTAVTVTLYAWSLPANGFAAYYSSAVASMAGSWKALLFGAFDPGVTVTLDKLPGAFIPQALSVRIFGLHPWAMALPQVIEGAIAVLVTHRVVRLWAGPKAALLATVIFAFTPLLVSMFGHPMEDGALTVCLVLAADACQRAIHSGRLRWLLLCGVWIGLGFQAKMLQAWMILPALGVGYLIAAKARPARRWAHLMAALAVTIAVSFSWTAIVSLFPAQDRPYADGTTNNSVWTQVLGYNGLERFGVHLPGSVRTLDSTQPGQPAQDGGDAAPPPSDGAQAGQPISDELTTLFLLRYPTQIAWLLPLLLVSLVFGLSRWRRQDRVTNGGFAMWTTWLVVSIVVFSQVGLAHTAYMASLVPPIAALCAAGTAVAWRAYRERRKGTRWVLPVTVLAQGAFAAVLTGAVEDFLPWLAPVILALTAASVLVLLVGLFERSAARLSRRAITAGFAAGLAAMVAAPVAWSASVLDHRYGGTAFEAEAGPVGPRAAAAFNGLMVQFVGQQALNAINDVPATLTGHQRRILEYVNANRRGAEYPFVTDSWVAASRYIIAVGEKPLAMAGFVGSAPYPSLVTAKQLVADGKARFFLLTGVYGMGDGKPAEEVTAITSWVRSTCRAVPLEEYQQQGVRMTAAPKPDDPTAKAVLYEC